MKIIEDRRAPNPRRVRVFLAEKHIEVPFEQVDIAQGDHLSPAFGDLNPWQRVPVLVLDDGAAVSESVAICRYFEEMHPEPRLMGETPRDKARIEMWNRRIELTLLAPIAQCFRHLHPAMAPYEVPQVAAWGEANRDKAHEGMRRLDAALATRAFIAGQSFSIADITALVAMDFIKPARIERPPELTNLVRWHEQVSARPSAKA